MLSGSAIVLVALSGAGILLLVQRDGEKEPAASSSPATTSPAAGCPVDAAICDFARRAEYELQEGDPKRLISPKSRYGGPGPTGVVDTILLGPDRATKVRVFAIGCPVVDRAADCSEYFSLVFTARAEGDELAGGPFGSRELLAFQRDGSELPILTLRAAMPAVDEVVKGGEFGRCYTTQDIPGPTCSGTMFYPFTTGPAVALSATPTPSALGATDPIEGLEVTELRPGMQSSIGYEHLGVLLHRVLRLRAAGGTEPVSRVPAHVR